MNKRTLPLLCLTGLLLVIFTGMRAQSLGQTDTFQDGTLNSWSSVALDSYSPH
jgi:hypothetical protein